MDICLALDVAKGKSMAILITEEGEILFGPKEFTHDVVDLEKLFTLANSKVKDYVVVMESTSVYHEQPMLFFRSKQRKVIVGNPYLISKINVSLRRTKTDKLDCQKIALAYFRGELKDNPKTTYESTLQSQSRLVDSISKDIAMNKTSFLSILSRCFPSIEKYISIKTIYSPGMLHFLEKYPHPDLVKNKSVDQIYKSLKMTKYGNGQIKSLANKIANINYYTVSPSITKNDPLCHILTYRASFLCELNKRHNEEKNYFIELAKKSEFFNVYKSFDGIGDLLAAYFVAEIGDITRFESEKKLTAYCGLDPTIKESGKSINYKGPISKSGNRYLRKHLYQAIMMILRNDGLKKTDSEITTYYKKKRNDDKKHHYVAVIACSTKLLRKFYYRAKDMIGSKN